MSTFAISCSLLSLTANLSFPLLCFDDFMCCWIIVFFSPTSSLQPVQNNVPADSLKFSPGNSGKCWRILTLGLLVPFGCTKCFPLGCKLHGTFRFLAKSEAVGAFKASIIYYTLSLCRWRVNVVRIVSWLIWHQWQTTWLPLESWKVKPLTCSQSPLSCIRFFREFWVLVFIFIKKAGAHGHGLLKKVNFYFIFSQKINFPGKMPLKCSNNAQCFCLTKMLEKMLA